MKISDKAILLASGGLDSTTLAYWLIDQGISFCPVFINYGQHCMETELSTLVDVMPSTHKKLIKVLNVSDVYRGSSSRLISEPNLWKEKVTHTDFYLPYRNLLFLTIGASYALAHGYVEIYTAFINSNHAKEIDCSAVFFNDLTSLLSDYGTIRVLMPFKTMTKYEVAKIGLSLHAPIGRTFSCQSSATIPCGACPNCVDRLEALKQLSDTVEI
jgi:7-cyano-7-deazaguanine synthase